MAMKSSKIAVTLEPSLKQKLREYGKENQIKNFSGVILSILDEHFGTEESPASPSTDLWQVINDLTARIDQLEGGTATTAASKEKPKKALKPKAAAKTAAKPKVSKPVTQTSGKSAKAEKPAKPVKKAATKPAKKSTTTKSKSTRTVKSSSKAAPVKKAKPVSTRKSSKAKTSASSQWMSTREAFDMYGGNLSWSRFSKLTPEELKERFNLDSDLSRKVRGSRFNQWLKLGK